MSTNRVILACLLLLGIIQVTGAIKCFDCFYEKENSKNKGDEKCSDSFEADSKFEVDCGNTTEFCYKSVGSTDDGEYKYEDKVQRGCDGWCSREGVTKVDGEIGKGTRYCCKGELCNSATAALPGLTVLLASSLLSWIV